MSTLRRALVGLCCSALAVALPTSGPALADPPVPVPDGSSITITGDGYGHGVGMSQYGAYKAARKGFGFKQILRFYYRGIDKQLGEAGGKVAVRITADDDTLVIDDGPGLKARSLGSGKTFGLDGVKAAKYWRVRAVSDGSRSEISYRTSRWHVLRSVPGDVELTGRDPLSLRLPGGVTDYRGALRSTSYDGGRVTVNVLPMESYVRGVVTSEMYSSWPQQALRAQAVASRTYAAYERAHTSRTAYDLCDTAACQAYRGVAGESSSGTQAVTATAHQVLTEEGSLAYAQFSASNGGWTVSDDRFSYLPAQQDKWEGTSPDYYKWTRTLTDAEIEAQWREVGDLASVTVDARDGNDREAARGGRVLSMTLTGEDGTTVTVDGATFQRRFGLKSTLFTVTS